MFDKPQDTAYTLEVDHPLHIPSGTQLAPHIHVFTVDLPPTPSFVLLTVPPLTTILGTQVVIYGKFSISPACSLPSQCYKIDTTHPRGHLLLYSSRLMRKFRQTINDLCLKEATLVGRSYTWSNERATPTLVKLDLWFGTVDCELAHSDNMLASLTSSIKDHSSLLMSLACDTCQTYL